MSTTKSEKAVEKATAPRKKGHSQTPEHRQKLADLQKERHAKARAAKIEADRINALKQDFDSKPTAEELPVSELRGDLQALPYQRVPEQRRIDKFAAEFDLAAGAGSDAHVPLALGSAYVEMPDFDGPADFLCKLRAGRIVGHHWDQHRPWTPRVLPSLPTD